MKRTSFVRFELFIYKFFVFFIQHKWIINNISPPYVIRVMNKGDLFWIRLNLWTISELFTRVSRVLRLLWSFVLALFIIFFYTTLTFYELLIGCHGFIYFSILTEVFSLYIMEVGLKIYHIQVVVNLTWYSGFAT